MSEFFQICFVLSKDTGSKVIEEKLLKKINLIFGANEYNGNSFAVFRNSKVVVDFYNEDDIEYNVLTISLDNFKFYQDHLDDTIIEIISFIDFVFKIDKSILFSFGIYEISMYLLSKTKKISEFSAALLNKFPIVFLRDEDINFKKIINNKNCNKTIKSKNTIAYINYDAQRLW